MESLESFVGHGLYIIILGIELSYLVTDKKVLSPKF